MKNVLNEIRLEHEVNKLVEKKSNGNSILCNFVIIKRVTVLVGHYVLRADFRIEVKDLLKIN